MWFVQHKLVARFLATVSAGFGEDEVLGALLVIEAPSTTVGSLLLLVVAVSF